MQRVDADCLNGTKEKEKESIRSQSSSGLSRVNNR